MRGVVLLRGGNVESRERMESIMKTMLLLGLLAAVTTFGQPQQAASQSAKPKTLTPAELDSFLAVPGRVLLIDVRRPDEIASNGGFPVYLSIQANDLARHLSGNSE